MIDVGILGATGIVGQQFIALLARHPWFRVAWLGASQRSEGKPYRDAAQWRLSAPLDDRVASMPLAPLRQFDLKSVMITTLQAVSGAGYPGVPSWDILGNVIPFIDGEEEKIESETQKILGCVGEKRIDPHPVTISAQTTRVAVHDGHTESISVGFEHRADTAAVIEALRTFKGRPQDLDLPSAPKPPIEYLAERNRPQPALDANRGRGMTVTVGRLRPCPVLDYKFIALGHNTIRGAAGAAILNAELMHREGLL